MTKMFKSVSETWNVVTGCRHACIYCYARILAEGRLKHLKRYGDGFQAVNFHADELRRKFKPGSLVFVVDMGDLFGSWIPAEWIEAVIQRVWQSPDTDFLFLTKNPWRYHQFTFPPNAILGATIETNRNYNLTTADPPTARYRALLRHKHPRKFVSIEPIQAFDLTIFHKMLSDIAPELIEIGADNYGFNLPEPTGPVVSELIKQSRRSCPKVVEKDGLFEALAKQFLHIPGEGETTRREGDQP